MLFFIRWTKTVFILIGFALIVFGGAGAVIFFNEVNDGGTRLSLKQQMALIAIIVGVIMFISSMVIVLIL